MTADCYTECRKIKVRKLYYPKILTIVNINISKSSSSLTFLTFLYKLTKSPKCICLILPFNIAARIQALDQFTAESVQ